MWKQGHRDQQPFRIINAPTDKYKFLFLACLRKLENSVRTHADTERTRTSKVPAIKPLTLLHAG